MNDIDTDAKQRTAAVSDAEHRTNVDLDRTTGSYRWSCSCGDGSRPVLPNHAAKSLADNHEKSAKAPQIPGQPDGIEDDSHDLPKLPGAAERVGDYIRANGGGIYDVLDGHPLYARDLEALRRAGEQVAELTAALAEARATADVRQRQLTDARAERDSAVKTLVAALTQSRAQATTYANEIGNLTAENARVRQQRDEALAALEADEEPSHPDLGGARHHAPNGCDDCSVEPGDWHRHPECPGNLRAIEREAATR